MAFKFFVYHTLVCFAAFQGIVDSQSLKVTPTYAQVNPGDRIKMLCQAPGSKLTYCRIMIPGENIVHVLSPNSGASSNLRYYGSNLENGDCGIEIDEAKDSHNGVFVCTVHKDGTSTESSANMTIVVTHKPHPPEIVIYSPTMTTSQNAYKEGDNLIAKCIVRDSRPATNVSWYLDDDFLSEGVGQPFLKDSSNANTYLTTEQNLTRILQASDNGRQLKCIADHQLLDENSKVGMKLLKVKYPPKPAGGKIQKFGLIEGSEGRINITIEANPQPSIIWYVSNVSIVAGESNINNRFTAEISNKGSGKWETTLIVDKLTKDDVDQRYSVKATNEFGEQIYEIEISTNPEPRILPISSGTVIIIVLIIVLVFLIIGGTLFARAKGRWCFAGHVIPRTAGESSDTESADHTTSEMKPKRSFISVFKKNSDKVTTIPEEPLKMDMKPSEEEIRAVTTDHEEPTVNQSIDNGEAVVYAELDIHSRNNEGPTIVRGDDDKTEYAEIIHTKSQQK